MSAGLKTPASIPNAEIDAAVATLVARHGAADGGAIRRGVAQVAERWWNEDGDRAAFASFCEEHYVHEERERVAMFARLGEALEQVDGHLLEVRRELMRPIELDTGPIGRADELLSNLDLAAHINEDLFRTKVAFLVLLNFPVHTLAERLALGQAWDRQTWARSRMAERFAERVPASVHQAATRASNAAERYIYGYFLQMDRVVTPEGTSLFPEGLRLISHWGLRDQLKSCYADGAGGLPRQRMIQRVMERIIRQEIPEAVRDNRDLVWYPETNETRPAGGGAPLAVPREPDTRYARLLDVFHAVRAADPYSPTAPTYIHRRFESERQMPEPGIEALFESILTCPEVATLARRIEERLGRPLEPFDIWYSGFSSRGSRTEGELDEIVRAKYPTKDAFQASLPEILARLGFAEERARWLSDRIVVDGSRGAGHAMPAYRREDKVHLRAHLTGGMGYKGFNIAMHELGHCVEQVFSLSAMDHWFLSGVPNVAFTEAMAFTFQSRDLELLGFSPDEEARRHEALHTLWTTYETAGVSLIDMRVWHWMYAHPDATPARLREATLSIAREVWNRYFTPVFAATDVEILAIYSHLIAAALYLPDYAIGHIVASQVAMRLREGIFGAEVERLTRLGCLTPDSWMRAAVGGPISVEPLLQEARVSLTALQAGTSLVRGATPT